MLQQSSVGGAGGKSKEEVVLELSVEFATKLPAAFDIELARYKYPVTYLESMNSVLHQEVIWFNRLTDVIRSSLVTVQKTLTGLVVMSADIDKLITNIFQSKMPVMWAPYSYPTMKPVSSYF
jgi:dynein heavy chain